MHVEDYEQKRLAKNVLSIAAMALVYSTVGCSGAETSLPPDDGAPIQTGTLRQADGRTLFRGIFFRDGAAASLLTDSLDRVGLREKTTGPASRLAQSPEAARAIDDVLDRIALRKPDIFTEFRTGMISGNHMLVAKALDSAAEAVQAELGQDKNPHLECDDCHFVTDIGGGGGSPGGGGGGGGGEGTFFNQNTAVNMDYAVNVHVAYNVDIVKSVTHVFAARDTSSGLLRDMLVDELTTQLR
jgi:hypothetical protein